ncbi:choice-of-anchor D domain-containing protein, partial [candidate division KSB1 bacterium]|nr:choice-of-anchor D domain-containing protein [candidate division KSB1 bacterium]
MLRRRQRQNLRLEIFFLILIFFGTCFGERAAAQNEWRAVNSPHGGKITALWIDPKNFDQVLAGTVGGGIFKSEDGGAQWHISSQGLHAWKINSLVAPPGENSPIFCGTASGLYRTTDLGQHWSFMAFEAESVRVVQIHPRYKNVMLLSTDTGLYKSENQGQSWQKINHDLPDQAIQAILFHATQESTIFVGTKSGIFVSHDLGGTWNSANSGQMVIQALAMHPQSDYTLFAATQNQGILRSYNGGTAWHFTNRNLLEKDFPVLVINPTNGGMLYAGSRNGGIFKTTDLGNAWTEVNQGLWYRKISALAFHPNSNDIVLAGTQNGVFRTRDAGANWIDATNGLNASKVNVITVNPQNKKSLLVGLDGDLFRSFDNGQSWQTVHPVFQNESVAQIVTAPADTNFVVVRMAQKPMLLITRDNGRTWYESQNFSEVQTVAVDHHQPPLIYAATTRGLFKSEDQGRSWLLQNKGLENLKIQTLLVNPLNAAELFIGTAGNGIFKTSTAGAEWYPVNSGLNEHTVYAIIHSRNAAAPVLWAGTAHGIYQSTNHAAQWTATGLLDQTVLNLEQDVSNPNLMYARTAAGILFLSQDGGQNWEPQNTPAQLSVLSFQADPFTGGVLLVGTEGKGLFQFRGLTPKIQLASQKIDFSRVRLDSVAIRSLVIQNVGESVLKIKAITLSDPAFYVAPFRSEIAVSQTETIHIQFRPQQIKRYNDVIRIVSNDPDAPEQLVSVTGLGAWPSLRISVNQVDFGQVRVNTAKVQPIQLSNVGNAALVITELRTSQKQFGVSPLTVRLEPTQSVSVQLTFMPDDSLAYHDQLLIQSNIGDTTISLHGLGITSRLVVSGTSFNFKEVVIGDSASTLILVQNAGLAPLAIRSLSQQSPARFPVSFSLDSIPPQSSRNLGVRFVPNEPKTYSDLLRLVTDGGEARIRFNGKGMAPRLQLTKKALRFETMRVGQTSAVQFNTLKNLSQVAVKISTRGPLHSEIFQLQPADSVLQAQDSIRFRIQFRPNRPGNFQDSVMVNGPFWTDFFTLTGEGIQPQLSISDTLVELDSVLMGQAITREFKLSNQGTAPLTINRWYLTDSTHFKVRGFRPQILPLDTLRLQIHFQPRAAQILTAYLKIESDAGDVQIGMHGIGVAPALNLSALAHDFGSWPVGQISTAWNLKLINPTSISQRLSRIQMQTTVNFLITPVDSLMLPHDSLLCQVQFQPSQAQVYADSLIIETQHRRYAVWLRGTGVTARLSLSDSELEFGTVFLSQEEKRHLQVVNSGDAPLQIWHWQLADTNIFKVEGSVSTLPAQDSISLYITFRPEAVHDYRDSLVIETESGRATIRLHGQGQIPQLNLSARAHDFGGVRVGKISRPWGLVVRNPQSFALTLLRPFIADSGHFRISRADAMVAALDSVQFQIEFQPTQARAYTDSLKIRSPYQDLVISLRGLGLLPQMVLADTSLEFGDVQVGWPQMRLLTLKNTGNDTLRRVHLQTQTPFFVVKPAPEHVLPGQKLALEIVFNPTTAQSYRDTLSITSEIGSAQVVLWGKGVGAGFRLSAQAYHFGAVEIQQTVTGKITLFNTAAYPFQINQLQFRSAEVFSVEPRQALVPPHDSLMIHLTFKPVAVKNYGDTLQILYETHQQIQLPVTGEGYRKTQAPFLTVQSDSLDFGRVLLFQSAKRTLQLQNTGGEKLIFTEIPKTPPEFQIAALPAALDSGQMFTVEVTFQPEKRMYYRQSWQLQTNANSGHALFKGTGVAGEISLADSILVFSKIAPGDTSHASCWIKNTGNDTLRITSVVSDRSVFSVALDADIIESGDSLLLRVNFAPESAGIFTAQLTIFSNDPMHARRRLYLSGVAEVVDQIPPQIQHLPVTIAPQGNAIAITAQIQDAQSGVTRAELIFRNGGERGFLNRLDLRGGTTTIPAHFANTRGIEYYLEATDQSGNSARLPAQQVFYIAIRTDAVGECSRDKQGQPLAQPAGSTQTTYRLFSIPLILENPTPAAVLG